MKNMTFCLSGTRRAENPPEIIVHPENKDVKVGDTLEMVCQVQGYPEPRVEFYNNGRKISCNGNCTIGMGRTLKNI